MSIISFPPMSVVVGFFLLLALVPMGLGLGILLTQLLLSPLRCPRTYPSSPAAWFLMLAFPLVFLGWHGTVLLFAVLLPALFHMLWKQLLLVGVVVVWEVVTRKRAKPQGAAQKAEAATPPAKRAPQVPLQYSLGDLLAVVFAVGASPLVVPLILAWRLDNSLVATYVGCAAFILLMAPRGLARLNHNRVTTWWVRALFLLVHPYFVFGCLLLGLSLGVLGPMALIDDLHKSTLGSFAVRQLVPATILAAAGCLLAFVAARYGQPQVEEVATAASGKCLFRGTFSGGQPT